MRKSPVASKIALRSRFHRSTERRDEICRAEEDWADISAQLYYKQGGRKRESH